MSAEVPTYRELLKEENLVEAELAPAMAMKLDNETLREAARKRRQEAGEAIRTTRAVRRRTRREPPPAVEGSGSAPVVEEGRTAEAAEERERVAETAEVQEQAAGAAPEVERTAEAIATAPEEERNARVVETAPEGERSAEAAETAPEEERSGEAVETVKAAEVIDLDSPAEGATPEAGPSGETPVREASVREGLARVAPVEGAGEQAISRPSTGIGPSPGPSGGGEAEVAAGESIVESGALEPDSSAPASQGPRLRAVKKARRAEETPMGPRGNPRPAPRYTTMEDAHLAEGLLEKLRLREFDMQLRQRTMSELLDGFLVSMLQSANGFLAIRDRIQHTSDIRARTLERMRWLEEKSKGLAKELEEKSRAAEQERAAVETDRDAWRDRYREAEASGLAAARSLESNRKVVEELTERLSKAEEEADRAKAQIQAAGEKVKTARSQTWAAEAKIREANKRAEEAEERADQAEGRANRAEELNEGLNERVEEISRTVARVKEEAEKAVADAGEEARKAYAAQLLVEGKLWDAEARFENAESRAWRAEAEVKETAEKMREVVDNAVHSSAVRREITEAATDAYFKGFADCKAKLVRAYGLEDADTIGPGDLDAPETPGPDAEEAGGANGEEAGNTPEL